MRGRAAQWMPKVGKKRNEAMKAAFRDIQEDGQPIRVLNEKLILSQKDIPDIIIFTDKL